MSPVGDHSLGSVYVGRIPRVGPPPPTRGPLPSDADGWVVAGADGIVVGISVGETSFCGGVLLTGLPSPPLFPATGAPVAFGSRRNPIRSAGISALLRAPKIITNAAGETRPGSHRLRRSSDPQDSRIRFAHDDHQRLEPASRLGKLYTIDCAIFAVVSKGRVTHCRKPWQRICCQKAK